MAYGDLHDLANLADCLPLLPLLFSLPPAVSQTVQACLHRGAFASSVPSVRNTLPPDITPRLTPIKSLLKDFFFLNLSIAGLFFLNINLLYIFIFVCVGSSLLHAGFL